MIFQTKERKQKKRYYLVLITVGIVNVINELLPFDDFGYFFNIFAMTLPMTILTYSFVRTRKMFLKYQQEKYQEIKTALWVYYVFDMLAYALQMILDVLYIVGVNSPHLIYI